jgi:hypothetical protein
VHLRSGPVRGRTRRLIAVGVMGALISAGAAAADLCHTPLAGTRSLTLRANVTGYQFDGNRVLVEWSRSARCRGTMFWEPSQPHTTASASCQQAATRGAHAGPKLTASDATHVVRVISAPIGVDKPDRLVVFDRATNGRIASWPLFERPARVALYGDIAILSENTRHELYAMRLSDGRMAQIGIARGGDSPLIGRLGVVYQDDLDFAKHRTAPAERTLKLLPLRTVGRELARPFSTVHLYASYSRPPAGRGAVRASTARSRHPTSSPPHHGALPPHPYRGDPITSMSMDGTRVALAVHDPTGRCDYVLFWNVAWHYVTRLTRWVGPQCLPVHGPGGITNVAISGSRAVWTTTYGGRTRVLAASITDCQEWVVARPRTGVERVAALAGDTGILAYALGSEQGFAANTISYVGVVPASWRGVPVERLRGRIVALSAYDRRIATLGSDGTAAITDLAVGVDKSRSIPARGTLAAEIQIGQARAIALRDHVLTALSARGRLDVYSLPSGRLLRSWPAPASASSLDVQYGIALITAGRDVYTLDTATGKTARLFHAPAKVAAQIEAPGAAIEFNNVGHGHIAFVPMSSIEASLR